MRSEVDQDAELIIGAITDERLDGKMRVSIVATALDGQQPEAKSVINMVHRIQNRNTGYSEFPSTSNMSSFNFNENKSLSSALINKPFPKFFDDCINISSSMQFNCITKQLA